MQVAHFWGLWPPSKFYEASREDQALAIQFYVSEQGKAAYQSKIDEMESKRKFSVSGAEND